MFSAFFKIGNIIGFSVCHQLPARCLIIGNYIMPVCSRCMGIYTGFMISTLVLLVLYRKKQAGFPPVFILVLSALFIISTAADGLLSYSGIFRTNNLIRMTTGYLAGLGLSVIWYPVFAWQFYKKPGEKKILKNKWHFPVLLLVAGIFLTAGIVKPAFLGIFLYFLNIIAVIFSFVYSNILILLLIPYFSKNAERFFSKYLIILLVFGSSLSFFEILLLKLFHSFMLRKF